MSNAQAHPRMKKVHKRSGKVGLPPGSLVHVGTGKQERSQLHLFQYDAGSVDELRPGSTDDLAPLLVGERKLWLNIDGLHDDGVIRFAAERFGLHPLLLEDILNTDHRP
jgi:magnesium transporter